MQELVVYPQQQQQQQGVISSSSPCCEDSGDEELSVLPKYTKVMVTGNNKTKSVLVGLRGVVKKAVGLGGWHWLDIISFGWAFFKPFTAEMWLLTAGFFFSGGMVVYLLERRKNPRFQGQPSKQFGNVLWFGFSTWFSNQDDIRTVMARIVVVSWLFVIGVLYSCYTANYRLF